jgi:hypothetical protein
VARRDRSGGAHDVSVVVDATFAAALDDVEHAVADLLDRQGDDERATVVQALSALDECIAAGDAHDHAFVSPGALGIAASEDVIGGTSSTSPVTRVPATVLRAAIALVTAARPAAVTWDVEALEILRAANTQLRAALDAVGETDPADEHAER